MTEPTKYDGVTIGDYTYMIQNDNGNWSVNVKDKSAVDDDDGKRIVSISKGQLEKLGGMVNKQQIFAFNKSGVDIAPEGGDADGTKPVGTVEQNGTVETDGTVEQNGTVETDGTETDGTVEKALTDNIAAIGAAIIHKNAKKTDFDNEEKAKITLAAAAASVANTIEIEEAAKKNSPENATLNKDTVVIETNENKQLKRELSSIGAAIILKNAKKIDMDNEEKAKITLAAAAAATDTTVDAEKQEAVRQEAERQEAVRLETARQEKQDTDNAERAKITLAAAAAATNTTVQAENQDDL
jgi:hypothetical protein